MNDNGIGLPDEGNQALQLRTLRVLPGSLVGKDLIVGLGSSAIGTSVERTTRFKMLLHLPRMAERGRLRIKNGPALAEHGTEAVRDAMTSTIAMLPGVYNSAHMTNDEREHMLSTVGQAHAGLSEMALKLRLSVPPNTPGLQTATQAARAAFDLKRALQRLEVTDVVSINMARAVGTRSSLRQYGAHQRRRGGMNGT